MPHAETSSPCGLGGLFGSMSDKIFFVFFAGGATLLCSMLLQRSMVPSLSCSRSIMPSSAMKTRHGICESLVEDSVEGLYFDSYFL